MKVNVLNLLVAEGSPEELGRYSTMIIVLLKSLNEHDEQEKAKKEAEAIAKALGINIQEMINEERDEGK